MFGLLLYLAMKPIAEEPVGTNKKSKSDAFINTRAHGALVTRLVTAVDYNQGCCFSEEDYAGVWGFHLPCMRDLLSPGHEDLFGYSRKRDEKKINLWCGLLQD